MNDYIFDWAENSEKILADRGYTTKVHQTFEQIMLFAYLREKGYSKDEIFDLWIKTDSLLLQRIGDDKDQRDKYFGKLFADSTKYKIEKGNRIDIYQSEIDFINGMEVSMWIKQYVLVMLCVYKWYGKEWCVYNDKIKRFCYSCTSTKIERERNIILLHSCIDKYKPYIINSRNNFLLYKILIPKEGLPIKTLNSPRGASQMFKILSREKKCSICGNFFEYMDNSINLSECPACRKRVRYKRQYQNIITRGGSEKSYNSENRQITD
jgi:hypothetical protein